MGMSGPLPNAKRERFCQEYLKDLNRTQAAIRAGYAERSAEMAGSRLMSNDKVADRVAKLQAERAAEAKIDAALVLKRLRQEGDLTGEGASHAARVTAWKAIGEHIGMFPKQLRHANADGSKLDPIGLIEFVRNATSPNGHVPANGSVAG